MDWFWNSDEDLYFTGKDREWQLSRNRGNEGDIPFWSLFHYGQFVGFCENGEEAERIIQTHLEIAS